MSYAENDIADGDMAGLSIKYNAKLFAVVPLVWLMKIDMVRMPVRVSWLMVMLMADIDVMVVDVLCARFGCVP